MTNTTEWAKVIVIVVIVIAVTILGFYQRIQSEAVVGLLSAALGYAIGNAHGFLQGVRIRNNSDLDSRMP